MSPRATKTDDRTSSNSKLDRGQLAGLSIFAILALAIPLHSCGDNRQSTSSSSITPVESIPVTLTPLRLPQPTPLTLEPRSLPQPTTITLEPQSSPQPTTLTMTPQNRKLPASTVLKKPARRGPGTLKVSNGTSGDAYLKLVAPDSSKLVAAFYVKANSTYTLKRIPDGVYQVLFVSGEDWDAKKRTFTRNASFSRFDRALNFVTTRQTKGRRIYTRYTIFTLTLNPVVGGNATTSGIDEREFANY